ncbi:MAG: hypothetical protein DI551_06915 [Micavibrio aeruginosavorus]|uniref:Nitroreductase domain-containing protein n=1 Tax=Micavibrio aeruginosavorus TaxID=349221 RepID=A0A2W5MYZ4_9BACT|nr:MAG: hypothetical protein DI551_06915 [Micavibrio aeruginosavorus]
MQKQYNAPFELALIRHDGESYLYEPRNEKTWPGELLENALLVRILGFCEAPQNEEDIIAFIKESANCDLSAADATFQELLDSELLCAHKEQDALFNGKDGWHDKAWDHALRFHAHTNEQKKTDYSSDPKGLGDKALMQQYVEAEMQPSSYKIFENAEIISLPKTEFPQADPFGKIVEGELYKDNSAPMNIGLFSKFLELGYGETGFRKMPVTGVHVGKTVPSGGSRHPTEVYPIVLDVEGVDNGIYHYNVKDHSLECILKGSFSDFVLKNLIRHKDRLSFNPKVVFMYTIIFERSMFRYRESRSYRVMHYDLGHILQNTSYLARSMRQKCYRNYSLNEEEVEKVLNLDALHESAMAVAAIG